jgi:biopolymer transport protein ExbD
MRPRSRYRQPTEADSGRFDFAPMVDVVLVLVIFFMLASSLIGAEQRLKVELPQAQAQAIRSPQPVTVTLSRSGTLAVNGRLISLAQLESVLHPLLERDSGEVLLRADRRVAYGAVVAVMSRIRAAGGRQIALATVQ